MSDHAEITGKTLIEWGFTPGKWFAEALTEAQRLAADGADEAEIRAHVAGFAPAPKLELRPAGSQPFHVNIEAGNDAEQGNIDQCVASMTALMRTPVVRTGALMPDACPTGSAGTIPVGGVVASEAIHPGMHSSDICCSVAFSNFGSVDPARLMDAVAAVTHFGGGGRPAGGQLAPPDTVLHAFDQNRLLRDKLDVAKAHFATQGDGNHFAFVGQSRSTGETILVTHHGSRGPGAALYKTGIRLAEKHTTAVASGIHKANVWIPADSDDGEAYWQALQAIRLWTRANHFAIHDAAAETVHARVRDRFWNEHNFVFRKTDGLFYHGKGATPAWDGWAEDASELTLIPLNMAEPVLVVRGRNAPHALGFSPHGAGRNLSRSAHVRRLGDHTPEEVVKAETQGLDVRFWCGRPDVSELPSAYKRADEVRRQIEQFGLAEVVDEIVPYGSIMAGDWLADFMQRKRAARAEAASGDEDADA